MSEVYWTFWLSRNRTNGVLESKVDVWLERPERLRFGDGDVQWVVLDEGKHTAHYTRWTLDQARAEVGNGVPQTDLELLYVERDPKPIEQEAA